MFIGIISYLPKDENVRKKRLEMHRKQIEWLNNIYGDKHKINIVAQGYSDSEYLQYDNIVYAKYPEPLGAAGGRNALMDLFYESDEKYILMLDDDCVLYDYYGATNLLKEFETNPSKFKGIDMIVANHPKYLPFKKDNYNDKNIVTHWKFTRRPFNTGQAFCIMKKVKNRIYYEPVYYEEDGKLIKIGLEDVDYHIKWTLNGYNSYTCNQWQLKEMGASCSTIYSGDRINEEKKALAHLLSTLPFKDKLIKNGRTSWKYLNDYGNHKKVGYIKRETPVSYTEKELPKGVNADGSE